MVVVEYVQNMNAIAFFIEIHKRESESYLRQSGIQTKGMSTNEYTAHSTQHTHTHIYMTHHLFRMTDDKQNTDIPATEHERHSLTPSGKTVR